MAIATAIALCASSRCSAAEHVLLHGYCDFVEGVPIPFDIEAVGRTGLLTIHWRQSVLPLLSDGSSLFSRKKDSAIQLEFFLKDEQTWIRIKGEDDSENVLAIGEHPLWIWARGIGLTDEQAEELEIK